MSAENAPPRAPETTSLGAPPADPRIAEIATWLGQFSRTLKTCRLYDATNPNTLRFREELGRQMVALLNTHGAFRLEFSAHQVACDGYPVMVARAREDNFAMPFYRDGLRTLTFQPDTEPRELEVIVDLLLRVTGRANNNGAEDLVTLLWDADMPHVDMTYVAAETDADMGDDGGEPLPASYEARAKEGIPWPGSKGGGISAVTASIAGAAAGAIGAPSSGPTGAAAAAMGVTLPGNEATAESASALDSGMKLRSEDWLAGEPAHELEASYVALDTVSAAEVDRFMTAMQEDRAMRLAPNALAMVRDAVRADLIESDRADLIDRLVRVLYEAIGGAHWNDARDAVDCLTECTEGQWDAAQLVETLGHPNSVVTASLVRHLDSNPLSEIHEFVTFARSLGGAAIEWVMGIVAIANHQRTRRTLVRALGELCEGNPERLAPWLADSRWYVVRNAVIAIASTDGGVPAGLFKPLLQHPEPRVRHEVVAALALADSDAARPLLLDLVRDEEPSIRNAALHQLGQRRDPVASAALLKLVLDPEFRKRPADDVRAITTALGGSAGEDALPHLEEQLYPPGWFNAGAGPYSVSIARCIARIGSPAAFEMLERGAKSRVAATREACKLVLKGLGRG